VVTLVRRSPKRSAEPVGGRSPAATITAPFAASAIFRPGPCGLYPALLEERVAEAALKLVELLARREGLELPTLRFEAPKKRSK
jgi:hypothetical protein